ncbi:polysaccharide biosynthesis/export family protein [Rhodophyticola sp. CCM32]|uniref:polysaccharide biosynthesis/export family protein n=1 Tax=Rhodophyticola sp. CCM32 TaxID=2916397 RepID=UPI00143DB490|nr:polysaccharide biosynthesis/export family protein [Rhodophyticola sp. CCM32]
MRFGIKLAYALLVWFGVISSMTSAAAAQDSYPIGPGDILNVSFLSNPDFNRTLTVGIDGSVFIPLIGEVNVQGQSINALREQIPLLMTGAVFRERINGEYLLVTVEPEEVMIEIDEYRPIYVDGSVISAGRQPFEIGMTARQAIAGADGLSDDGLIDGAGVAVRNHPRVLMAELVGVLAEMAVHEAILSGSDTIDAAGFEGLNAPPSLIENAISLARSQVATSTEILSEELAFLETSVTEAEARVIASLRHEEVMTAIAETEETEVERVENLVARRVVSSELLTQTRRLYLQAVERLGNVQADRLAAEADRRELVLERNQALRERALQTQARLQELSQQASQLRVRIGLSSTGPMTLDLDQTSSRAPRIVIFRQTGGQAQEIEAAPETLLLPGDVLNVSFAS